MNISMTDGKFLHKRNVEFNITLKESFGYIKSCNNHGHIKQERKEKEKKMFL